jgi:cation diffusion facilitator family transporter
MDRSNINRYAWLSICAAVLTIALKGVAYLLTGSVGLLSDAIESVVNLVGACMALAMLTIAARPPDEDHLYGHNKAEYFSSGVEGALIVLAAVSIGAAAVERIIHPQFIHQALMGLLVSFVASMINLGVAIVLIRAGKRFNSITLEADARHLITDVWTSAGVICAISVVALTGWQILDPIIALVVAANIIWTGFKLVQRSASGLMDSSLPKEEVKEIEKVLERYKALGVQFHALRTRQAASRRFLTVHVLVPGTWTVMYGHQILEALEAEIRNTMPEVTVFTHMEPVDDPSAMHDIDL